MGGADVIPGVSGGTMALILGIYERLVTAISRVDLHFLSLLRGRRWTEAAAHVDLRFLVALGSGILLGVGGLATVMHHLLETYPQFTFAAFFGLILASTVLVGRMVERWTLFSGFLLVLFALFAYWLVGLVAMRVPPAGEWYLFVCGMVAICAMILPGISGAFILLLLGKYFAMTGLLKNLLHGDLSAATVVPVAVFLAGCVLGLLSFSKLLSWFLDRHEPQTMAALCGFMAGSLRRIWPFKQDLTPEVEKFQLKQFANVLPESLDGEVLLTIGIAVLAAAFVLLLDRLTRTHEHVPHLQSRQAETEG